MADESLAPTESIDLELAKTQLRLSGRELQRLNSNDRPVLKIGLDDVKSVDLIRRFDRVSLLFLAVGVGLAVIGKYVSENSLLTVILYVIALPVTAMGFFAMQWPAVIFIIQTKEDAVRVQCNDPWDEAECFVASLRNVMAKGRAAKTDDVAPAEQAP